MNIKPKIADPIIQYLCKVRRKPIPDEIENWQPSQEDRMIYELQNDFDKRRRAGYSLYHLTCTYIEPSSHPLTPRLINGLFKNFYLRYFLKQVVGSNFIRGHLRIIQPITYCFVEEHEMMRSKHAYGPKANEWHPEHEEKLFPARLHHHAVIAAHPETVDRFNEFLGKNTFDPNNNYCKAFMTTCLVFTPVGKSIVVYATKKRKYLDEYQAFSGDIGSIDRDKQKALH